jgi:hypothetical protein
MTDSLANVVLPYSRFVEGQKRRGRIAAELTQRDRPVTMHVEVVTAVAEAAPPRSEPPGKR